jgi:hypothetical protein
MISEPVSFHFPKTLPAPNYGVLVGRWAVLYPLRGMPENDTMLRGATLSVVKEWRDRLRDLDSYGAGVTRSDPMYASMINCPPVFIGGVKPALHRCNYTTTCPHCWARWAGFRIWPTVERGFFEGVVAAESEPEQALSASLPPGLRRRRVAFTAEPEPVLDQPKARGPTPRSPYNLLERTLTLPGRSLWIRADGNRANMPALPSFFALRNKGRASDHFGRAYDFLAARNAGVIGGFEHMTVALRRRSTRAQPDGWVVTIRQVFAIPQGLDPEAIKFSVPARLSDGTPPGSVVNKLTSSPSRGNVASAVARACLYPALLMNGPIELAHAYLSARTGCRLSAFSGTFRNRK